jgi:5-methylthioadenosine/S-adenosylhomocysteine deaminase
MGTTLITADRVMTLDGREALFEPGGILVDGERIAAVGTPEELAARQPDDTVRLGARLVMPGLVNAHTHSPMTLFRGHAEGRSLFTLEGWFNTIRGLEAVMAPDMLPAAVAVSCAEMIRTGTTCFADQYFWMDRIAPVVRQSGLRAALAYGIVELGDEVARARELRAAGDFLESLTGDPLIRGWVGPHAFFVDNSEAAMRQEVALAARFGTGLHIHLGTSGEEDRYTQAHYGRSAVTQLAAMGVLERPVLAAHCLTVPVDDLPTLAQHPFTAAIAPSSAMRNAAGVPPLTAMHAAGVNTALGTDNVTNNNSYDLFKEMQILGKLMSLHERRPNAVPTRKLLEMATLGGARALGLEDEIGSLEPGKRADLISLDLDEIGWSPGAGQDPYTALVYSVTGQHVRDVMVNGQWLFRDNRWMTLDFAAARRGLEEAHAALMDRLTTDDGRQTTEG